MEVLKYGQLSKEEKGLLDAAEKVMKNAYNPYSKFFVGAALLTENDEIITGANIESATYGSSLCAERVAILRATEKGQKMFKALAIIARGHDFDTKDVTAPCGSCRQILHEFSQTSGHDLEVILSTTRKDKIVKTSIKELFPLGSS